MKKILHKLLAFLLREKTTIAKSNIYIKDDIIITGKVTVTYSRLFKSYTVNSKTEKQLHCKIEDMYNTIKVYTPYTHFIFVEKRGWKHSVSIELFCEKYNKDYICDIILKNKLLVK